MRNLSLNIKDSLEAKKLDKNNSCILISSFKIDKCMWIEWWIYNNCVLTSSMRILCNFCLSASYCFLISWLRSYKIQQIIVCNMFIRLYISLYNSLSLIFFHDLHIPWLFDYCDGMGCHVLCRRLGIPVWQHIGQSSTATRRHRRDMTSDVSKRR